MTCQNGENLSENGKTEVVLTTEERIPALFEFYVNTFKSIIIR